MESCRVSNLRFIALGAQEPMLNCFPAHSSQSWSLLKKMPSDVQDFRVIIDLDGVLIDFVQEHAVSAFNAVNDTQLKKNTFARTSLFLGAS